MLPDLSLEGSVDDLRSGVFQVLSNNGQQWLVRTLPNTTVRVTGKATVDFLASNECIAFLADVDVKRSRIEDPVSRLLVYTPDPQWPLRASNAGPGKRHLREGVAEEGRSGQARRHAGDARPRRRRSGGFCADTPPAGRKSKSAPAAVAPATQSLEVRGEITASKAGKLTVRVPTTTFKGPLKIDVADDAEIQLDLSGANAISLAQKGDTIKVRGQQLGERMGQAREIEITLAQPATAGTSKKRPAAKAASKKDDKAAE